MKLTDILIIYFACGAPFGVYYYLQNRIKSVPGKLWFNTLVNFVFWVPIAFNLLRKYKMLKSLSDSSFKNKDLDKVQENKLNLIQKQLEKISQKSSLKISIYELRETIDRYIGLILANQNQDGKVSIANKEFFRISKNKNVELAAICLNRRNQRLLSFHHTRARQDFLHLIDNLFGFDSATKTIENLAFEFVKILNDPEAHIALEKMFSSTPQTGKHFIVKQLEKDLWNPETHKPLPINPISTRLQPMTAATNLRSKD